MLTDRGRNQFTIKEKYQIIQITEAPVGLDGLYITHPSKPKT